MSTRQRVERTLYGAVASVCAIFFAALVFELIANGGLRDQMLFNVVLWGSGVATLVFSIAACRVSDDSTGEPGYLHSIVDGLRSEWHRDEAA